MGFAEGFDKPDLQRGPISEDARRTLEAVWHKSDADSQAKRGGAMIFANSLANARPLASDISLAQTAF